ncbi:MAG: dihydroorotate dehydrogenase, partial [Firmicutes bacterium]|nr:dihydroorotate dehydrogenase [Bacillota bacterium]
NGGQGGCGGDEEFFAKIPAPDLEVQIGSFTMKSPLATAAGCYGYGIEYKDYQKLSELGAVFSIGTTLEPCYGAAQPRMLEGSANVLTNTGYENPGVEAFKKDILPQIVAENADFVLNICGSSAEEMAAVAAAVADEAGVGAVELNLACIDAATGKAFAADAELTAKAVAAAKAAGPKPVIAKLSACVTDITEIALAAEAAGADALTLVNPPAGLAMSIYDGKPILSEKIGFVSGPSVKPIALKAVWEVSKVVKIPIIGCGGIVDGFDIIEFLQAGASAVQIGAANFIQPDTYAALQAFLIRFMKMNGFVGLNKLVGIAHKEVK